MMEWILTILILLVVVALLPFATYLAVVLGTLAHLRAKDLYRKHNPRGVRKNGNEKAKSEA